MNEMTPENPLPELIIHPPPPQREPAWTVWDLLLILIFAFASFMLVDMNDYAIARRGTEEQILAKEKRLIEKLKDRN